MYNRAGWCQIVTYLTHVSSCLSAWLVMGFTMERFVAVCYPLLRPTVCTARRARLVITVMTGTAIVLYGYLFTAAGIAIYANQDMCVLKKEYYYLGYVMNNVDCVVTLVLPVVIIVALNLRIVHCVWYIGLITPENLQPAELQQANTSQQIKVTKTLLIVSTVFVILNFPSHAMRAYVFIMVSIL